MNFASKEYFQSFHFHHILGQLDNNESFNKDQLLPTALEFQVGWLSKCQQRKGKSQIQKQIWQIEYEIADDNDMNHVNIPAENMAQSEFFESFRFFFTSYRPMQHFI